MCLVCRCTHCKDGDCDGFHHAHDWVRKVRDNDLPERIAIIGMMHDEQWDEAQAKAYLDYKFTWVKDLQPWQKDEH